MFVIPCNGCLGPLPTVSDNFIAIGCSVPTTNPNTVTVSYPTNYTGDVDNINPIPATITIQNPTADTWIVTMAPSDGSPAVMFTVGPVVLDPLFPLITTQATTFNTDPQGFAVGTPTTIPVQICGQAVTLNRIRITGTVLPDINNPDNESTLFLLNSEYVIDIGRTAGGVLLASVTVTLPKRGSFSSQMTNDLNSLTNLVDLSCLNNLNCSSDLSCLTSLSNLNLTSLMDLTKRFTTDRILVPIILIEGQTLIDASDLSDMKFTIKDELCYYEEKPLCDTECGIFCTNPCKLKTTIFRKCCKDTSLCRVLRGEGRNAFEKAMNLYKNDPVLRTTTTFPQFYYQSLILYAMSKYILSRILYGKFNIKSLLGKYNKQFFIDLGMSRFCGALRIYNDADNLASYDRFFLFDSVC